ncbi:serine aminopeptidase domain-containing protein [Paraburkholderia lacunae]|uniref:Alpha/beta hydrolase n=1 Tax=Paraburkholderia lacunae TaxID=2211104 RepID=A0A370NDP4_9BURK|nr:alpha/beta hydrolase [Paraburkholderia lacunae]RDK03668.1 alpha/beta hydrolase [Paraburkholderia lacunae]
MRSVVFDGCFGWLHPAAGERGVVLCNPFGYDALCTHRGWRKLAERIAAAGMPALRFDYPGAGDSAGMEDDPQRVDAWLDSIAAATRRLREWTGATSVSLVGLRLGATLAALAAQRLGDIDGLALLAPPLTGRNYLRELRAHRQSWLSTPAGMNADPIADPDAYVEAFGFGLHGGDIARIGALDLRADTTRPARRVLLLDSSDHRRGDALAGHYAGHGVLVERGAFDECDRFVIEALYSEEPVAAFSRVTQWLADGAAGATCSARSSATTVQSAATEPVLTLDNAVERPIVLGNCFGIYCEPLVARGDPGGSTPPAMLFVNTGASHHIGDGRIFVLFARRLAELGIASLRMDLSGLGDAAPAAAAITLDTIYSETACNDAAAGADWLVAQGHARVVTFGVCGGAFVGLHACARHPNIVGGFGVNLQKFIWDGAAREPGAQQFASSKVYWRSALTPAKWSRALLGRSRPLQIAGVLGKRLTRRCWLAAVGWIEHRTGWPLARNEVRDIVRALHAKGVQMRLAYGEFDVGLDEARVQFGTRLGALLRYPRVRAVTLPKLDHALFTRPAREAAMADAEQWLFAEVMRVGVPGAAATASAIASVASVASVASLASVASVASVVPVDPVASVASVPATETACSATPAHFQDPSACAPGGGASASRTSAHPRFDGVRP